jgi:hypothetical protein
MLLKGINCPPLTLPLIYCDNDAALRLAEDQVWHSRVKHIRVKYHYVREQILQKKLKVTRVRTKDNVADLLTKPLSRPDFLRHRTNLGLHAPTGEEDTKALISSAQLLLLPFNTYHALYTYNHTSYHPDHKSQDTDDISYHTILYTIPYHIPASHTIPSCTIPYSISHHTIPYTTPHTISYSSITPYPADARVEEDC